jgi:hypothetical protein
MAVGDGDQVNVAGDRSLRQIGVDDDPPRSLDKHACMSEPGASHEGE